MYKLHFDNFLINEHDDDEELAYFSSSADSIGGRQYTVKSANRHFKQGFLLGFFTSNDSSLTAFEIRNDEMTTEYTQLHLY